MKPVSSIKASAENPAKPSVLAGDSIYYHHPDTEAPHHGVVAGIGKDGMLVDADGGGEHQVMWDKYIAHRARAERKLTIVDRGEDGSIMEDENGNRVFVQGKLDDYLPPESGLAKALVALPADPKDHPLAESMRSIGMMLAESMRSNAEVSADIVSAIGSLKDSQAAQFQGLCAAIAMMSERNGDVASMQQAMLAALTEARKPQDIQINLPDGMMQKSEPANVQVDVHVPQQAVPVITMEAPIVHVAIPEAPAPVITFSPVLNMPEQVSPIVHVSIPPKRTVTEIERDKDGNMKRAIQTEVNTQEGI